MTAITLYQSLQPTRSKRALWALLEADLPFERVDLDLLRKEHKSEEILALNPAGYTPAARIDGHGMMESSALALFAAQRSEVPQLLPATTSHLGRACLQWCFYAPAELDPHLSTIAAHGYLIPPPKRRADRVEDGKTSLSKRLSVVERALAEGPYLLGDHFSIADVVVGHGVAWARMFDLLHAHPQLKRYLSRLEQRPAFLEAYGGPVQTFKDPYASH